MTIKVFEVGGAVRDSLRGVKSNDIDYAIEAESYQVMKEYVESVGATIFVEHPEFVTIRAKWNKQACDFTLCRKESCYLDNRHPSRVEPGTILEDLARRDFTINAIARDVQSGEILDPFGGQEDIKNGKIKAVGNAYDRFKEDALRILRALRFSIVLGFSTSNQTEAAIEDQIHLLDNISAERIQAELEKMFKFNTTETMRRLSQLGRHAQSHIFNERTGIWLLPTMKEK